MHSVWDHLTIHVTLAIPRSYRPGRVSFSCNIHAIRPEDLEYELGLIDWFPLNATSHVDKIMLISYFIASLTAILTITCRGVSRPLAALLNGTVWRLIELKRPVLFRYRRSQSLDWQRYNSLRNDVNIAVCREKKSFSTWLIIDSSLSFWRNFKF